MADPSEPAPPRGAVVPALLLAAIIAVLAIGGCFLVRHFDASAEPDPRITREVHELCAACHAYPPPDSATLWRNQGKKQ